MDQGGVFVILFKMVRYHQKKYPSYIPLHLEEVAGHFDVRRVFPTLPYSLHTEYSYGKRTFQSELIQKYPEIVRANQDGIPQLWKNEVWAESFAAFLMELTKNMPAPSVIEIHPPFHDYVGSMREFIEIYQVFETQIKSRWQETDILIENRCGSRYRGGRFLISTAPQIKELCAWIESEHLKLRIAFDIPQLYTAHQVTPKRSYEICALLEKLKEIRQYIGGVHIWGKRTSHSRRISHCGDLNTYFNNDMQLKAAFLDSLGRLFSDNQVRNLVLEVNSHSEDLCSIIEDLNKAGVSYV